MSDCIEVIRDGSFLLTLKEIEKQAIVKALAISRNRDEAAKVLGIGRSTLYRKIDIYGLCDEKKRRERQLALIEEIKRERAEHEEAGTLLVPA